jgi:nucleoside-diphosphate-sugar epimerase
MGIPLPEHLSLSASTSLKHLTKDTKATDVSFDPDAKKVIPNVVSATEAVLQAAAESSVKRVVLTSSSSSALLPQPGVEGIVVTEGRSRHQPISNQHCVAMFYIDNVGRYLE